MSIANAIHASTVETYIESHLSTPDPAITHARETTHQHNIPSISLSPGQGRFLKMLASCTKAQNILELGTLGGHSTIWLSRAIKERGGKVTSIDINPLHRDVATENLRFAGVKVPEDVEILLGAGLDILPSLEKDIQSGVREPFDFVFIDADWPNQWRYFDYGVRLARGTGSVLFVDNAVAALLDYGVVGPEERDEGFVSLVEEVGRDERVEAVVVQTVGARSYDGFLMAVVN
ncbi:S-adenosyl-L-methionine-dependent methyltransferase [Aspergillus heteromorphus CBS 117.55]|uniref:S-adenosyl-L-methionine-dependent methyltransferase n=1 Tax=Aspergillus heteromorphus CBS 117.55 TaxID=1448321 RepID=A0A317W2G9_9EURO|nr:S-adenosyl-L-methionine-dependent methyltransferase [Aspergillus heteromorphus CBS 117.55]PWY78370.1 S-adenosyl-L-methionine-dependent methyltransferase [Aspergillus heteromorphus CBS 117.55]